MITTAEFEIKLMRPETKEGVLERIIDQLEVDEEMASDFEYFFDQEIPEAFVKALDKAKNKTWDFVTLETQLNDDLEYEGYIAIFCSDAIAFSNNCVVEFDIEISETGEVGKINEEITAASEHMEEARMDMI